MSLSAIRISVSGLNAATTRLEAAASNIASAQSTGTVPDAAGATTAYQPVAVRQQALPDGGVSASMVRVPSAYTLQQDPLSPDADAAGTVAAPDISLVSETVDVMLSKLSYQASLKTLRAASDMEKTVIDLLR